ncbi:hypothetical protein FHS82_003709 [Pseudochelatococcus lubricantis]|uniref:Ankyrin repeat domain-containing protein n=2 Tax=Pseudochelatococcus lubricantis TaxID=1538102 RepID=A0ABX0V5H8_9HYPH|nr:hypothetical protein [Pseudochelatococcus lubricantis]
MLRRAFVLGAALLALTSAPFMAAGETMSETPLHATPLHTAAKRNDVARIEALLADGADIEARDDSGATALLVATHENNVAAARLLIAAGADVNAKDKISDSPYLYAGARGHLDILKLTLTHGADLKSTNRFGGTALIPASERGHVETVRTLIAAGVDVDHVNNLGWTALLEAVILGNGGERHRQIVDVLIKAGADINLADREGVSPLQHARGHGYDEIEQLLVAAGAR